MYQNFPKLDSPFVREMVDGAYVVTPKIKEEYRWIFTEGSLAVEKLDGTNVSVWIKNGRPHSILNRTNAIDIWKKENEVFFTGVIESIGRGYIKPLLCEDGPVFGELIGPGIQKNSYSLSHSLWIPFSYLIERYHFRFWPDFIKELKGKNDQEIFSAVDDLFKGLWSVYKRQRDIKSVVDENTKFEGCAAEGIVFYRKGLEGIYSQCCKLRRDMFSWFKGRRQRDDNTKYS